MEERLVSLEVRFANAEKDIDELKLSFNNKLDQIATDIHDLRSDYSETFGTTQKLQGFMGGAVFILTGIGAMVGAAITWLTRNT